MARAGVDVSGKEWLGLDGFRYAHEVVVKYIDGLPAETKGLLPTAYFSFLAICALTTLDSGYIALKWFLGITLGKSNSLLVGMMPKRLLDSPIPTFVIVALITLGGLWLRLELEYFMVFYASFFVGYASLAIARCFVPNSQHPLPQIRMFSLASISLVIFSFGYVTATNVLLIVGSMLPLIYVMWLVFNADLLRVVTERAGEVMDAASEIPALKALSKTAAAVTHSQVVAPQPQDAHALSGHFEGKWFVYSLIATYADTNSVGNVYFGMYGMFVGKTRELFFNTVMPDFDLKTTKFYILTRSFEHKFVRESREFDTITVKIKVADFNRKFCTWNTRSSARTTSCWARGNRACCSFPRRITACWTFRRKCTRRSCRISNDGRSDAGERVAVHAAQFEDLEDGLLDQIVGARGAGGDADGHRTPRREQLGVVGNDLLAAVQVVVDDFLQRLDAGGSADEKRRQFRLGHFHEVGGVRAVVSTDDEQHVHRFAQHLEQRVLAFLGRSANGVEHLEIRAVAIAVRDGDSGRAAGSPRSRFSTWSSGWRARPVCR